MPCSLGYSSSSPLFVEASATHPVHASLYYTQENPLNVALGNSTSVVPLHTIPALPESYSVTNTYAAPMYVRTYETDSLNTTPTLPSIYSVEIDEKTSGLGTVDHPIIIGGSRNIPFGQGYIDNTSSQLSGTMAPYNDSCLATIPHQAEWNGSAMSYNFGPSLRYASLNSCSAGSTLTHAV